MCLIISSHFSSAHQAEITSCQHHLRPWKFLVLSMNTGIPPVRSSSDLDTRQHTHRHRHTSSPKFLFFFFFVHHVLSLLSFSSVIMLFKKKTQLYQISTRISLRILSFSYRTTMEKDQCPFPFYILFYNSSLLVFLAEIILLCTCTKVSNTCE